MLQFFFNWRPSAVIAADKSKSKFYWYRIIWKRLDLFHLTTKTPISTCMHNENGQTLDNLFALIKIWKLVDKLKYIHKMENISSRLWQKRPPAYPVQAFIQAHFSWNFFETGPNGHIQEKLRIRSIFPSIWNLGSSFLANFEFKSWFPSWKEDARWIFRNSVGIIKERWRTSKAN